MKGRNLVAYQAQFRNSAGSMKHRCEAKGGTSNKFSSYMEEYDLACSGGEDNFAREENLNVIPVSGSVGNFDQEA